MNNQEKIRGFILLIFSSVLLSGCAGVTYETAVNRNGDVAKDPASPQESAFAFSLRSSDLLLTKVADTSNDSGTLKPKNNLLVEFEDLPCAGKPTAACLKGAITISTSPAIDSAVYFAEAKSTDHFYNFGHTTLTPKYDTTNTTMLTGVGFNYANQVPALLGAAGAGAAAGMAFGPWGAVIGGTVGFAGAYVGGGYSPYEYQEQYSPSSKVKPVAEDYICDEDKKSYEADADTQHPPTKTLSLPVSLAYQSFALSDADVPTGKKGNIVEDVIGEKNSLDASEKQYVSCWHKFPEGKNSGWFYKLDPKKDPIVKQAIPPVLTYKNFIQSSSVKLVNPNPGVPFPFMTAGSFFKSTDTRQTFPVSACVSVDLQIAWWSDINETTSNTLDTTLTVADPNFVQVVGWQDNSTVTVAACGGFENTGTPSQPVSDDFSALIKQVQAVKTAQQSYAKDNK
jgi:hypothetical protein